MPININLPKNEPEQIPVKTERAIQNVTFFGDSALQENDPFYQEAFKVAKLLAQNNYGIVNGGGPGIMKAATDGAESVKGRTIAIYWQPKLASYFEGRNLANVTDEYATQSNYLIRTLELIAKGDAYVIFKGGTGTFSEFGMVWALAKLYYGSHKPVILYGAFWDGLISSLQEYLYLDEIELGALYRATTPEQVIDLLKKHEVKIRHAVKRTTSTERAFLIGNISQITAKTYDQMASTYHSEHAGKLVAQAQLDEFISLVNPPARILDIGSGPGYDARYLSEKYSVTGIEISRRFADIAQYENPNIEFINADIMNFDIGVNKYKGIWARDSVHHIPDVQLDNVFQKIGAALVTNGIFYCIVREGKGEKTVKQTNNYMHLEKFYHFFTTEELIARAQKAGLKLIKIDKTKRTHTWIVGIFQK